MSKIERCAERGMSSVCCVSQEYLFRVKCPGAKSSDGMITIGKADVDLAEFVDQTGRLKTVSIEVSHSIWIHVLGQGSWVLFTGFF